MGERWWVRSWAGVGGEMGKGFSRVRDEKFWWRRCFEGFEASVLLRLDWYGGVSVGKGVYF